MFLGLAVLGCGASEKSTEHQNSDPTTASAPTAEGGEEGLPGESRGPANLPHPSRSTRHEHVPWSLRHRYSLPASESFAGANMPTRQVPWYLNSNRGTQPRKPHSPDGPLPMSKEEIFKPA